MLSSELAELPGVTVRTLRHYHQIGLLPEPRRASGGYWITRRQPFHSHTPASPNNSTAS